MKKIIKYLFITIFSLIFLLMIYLSIKTPSLDRDWNLDQILLPEISFSWSEVSIKNIRNFEYKSTTDYIANYYDKAFNLDENR